MKFREVDLEEEAKLLEEETELLEDAKTMNRSIFLMHKGSYKWKRRGPLCKWRSIFFPMGPNFSRDKFI